ncbi:MAG TPA: GNAT family N-acetyltransferase, partial [Anaerolineaceae bacterium]|nr:GNAT family N-acetyltransferase [Anaerolineaceae bacterium]
ERWINMNDAYQIVQLDQPAWEIIGGGIQEYNIQQTWDDHARSLCFVLQGPDREIVGGVIGATYWEWLHVDLMWLREDHRGRGYGHQLLEMAEVEARKRGARYAYLDTFDFQAPEFYKKYGYEVFGVLEDFPSGHTRYFMKKQL